MTPGLTPSHHINLGREMARFLDDYIEGRPVNMRRAVELLSRLEDAIREAEAIEDSDG
jgi:hypothetical protein